MPEKGYQDPCTEYDVPAQSFQNSLTQVENMRGMGFTRGGLATIIKSYSDRNTCDIRSWNGAHVNNVPVRTKGGVINGEIYGELDMPQEGDVVIVEMAGGQEAQPYITGIIIPYLHNTWQSSVPVNSANKQYTKKLLEAGKPKYYRRIFPSGLTVEVQDDATVIIEKPDGTYFTLKNDGTFDVIDQYQNRIRSTNTKSVFVNEHLEVKQ